jgi:hypothetical protein
MKTLMCMLLILTIAAVCHADLKIVQKNETGAMMGQPAKNFMQTIYIKGDKARMDLSEAGMYQIIDLKSRKVMNVDPAKKQVMTMDIDMMKKMSGPMMGMMGKDMKGSVKKTGNSNTINGFKCDEYVITMTGSISMTNTECVTTAEDASEFEPMRTYFQEFAKMMNMDASQLPPGIPVHSNMKMSMFGQNITGRSEVQSISHDPVADSMFAIPPDYKVEEMKMPQMPNMKP